VNRFRGLALSLLALALSCASVRRETGLDPQALRAVPAFALWARADDPGVEPFLAQRAREMLAPLLPLGEGPGRVVLRFSVREPRPAASFSLGISSSGSSASGPLSPPPAVLPGVPEPRRRTWVDADLLVRVEDGSGRALYSAAASVRGRRHLVESPQQAAEVCLKRVARDLTAFLGRAGAPPLPPP